VYHVRHDDPSRTRLLASAAPSRARSGAPRTDQLAPATAVLPEQVMAARSAMAEVPGRFRNRNGKGTGVRLRPSLQTTIARESDEFLRAMAERTGKPIGQIIDEAIDLLRKSDR